MVYFPQSSGKLKHINKTTKTTITKLCQETQLHRDQLLLIALLRIRLRPTKWTGFSPFEILFACPPPLVKGLQGDLKKIGDLILRQHIGLTLSKIND
jgi:hypothetical protein